MEAAPKVALEEFQVAAVRLSLFIRKYCAVHSRGACLFLTAYEALNLTSIALANPDYAWHSSVPSSLWQVLRLLGQTATFIHDTGVPDYAMMTSLLTSLSLLLLALSYLTWALSRLQDFEFRRVLSGEKKIRFQSITRTIVLTCVVVHEVMYIPFLDWLNGTDLLVKSAYGVQIWLAITVVCCTVYFTSYKLGSSAYNSMSSPFQALYGKVTYTLFVLSVSLFPYSSHSILHQVSYLCLGLFWLFQVFAKLPYQRFLLNQIEIAKATLITCTGLSLVIANVADLGGLSFLLMHIILYIACLMAIFIVHQEYISYLATKKEITYEFEMELRLQWHLKGKLYDKIARKAIKSTKELRKSLDTVEFDALCQDAYRKFPSRPYILMCFIEYFTILKEKTFVKVLLSKLQTLPKDVLSFVDVACCEYAVMNGFAAMKSDQEAIQYLRLLQHIKRVKEQDEVLCIALHRLVLLYEPPHFRSLDLSALLPFLFHQLKVTKLTYESLSQVIGDNPVFGTLYSGFLRLCQNHDKAHQIESRLKHMKHEMNAKYRAKEESVFYFDEKNMVLLVSLHASSMGKIVLSSGAGLLNYQDSDLIDSNCTLLIPGMFHARHSDHLRKVYSYRHKHPIFQGVYRQLVMDKQGFVHWAHWKIRLINYEKGKIAVMVAIRLVEENSEFAVLKNGQIENMSEKFSDFIQQNPEIREKIENKLNSAYISPGSLLHTVQINEKEVHFRFQSTKLIHILEVKTVVMSEHESNFPSKALSGKSVYFDVFSPSEISVFPKENSKKTPIKVPISSQSHQIFLQNLHFSVKLLKFFIGVVVLGVLTGVCAQTGLIIGLSSQIIDLKNDISVIENLSFLRFALQKATLNAREIHLNVFNSLYFSRNKAEIVSDLVNLRSDIGNLTMFLLDSGLSEFTERGMDWWRVEPSRIWMRPKNVVDICEYLERSVNKILESEGSEEVLRELMRNGYSETAESLTNAIERRVKFHKDTFEDAKNVIIVPLFVVFYSLMVIFAVFSVVLIIKINRYRYLLLSKYATLPAETVLNFHFQVANRLEQVHSYDSVSSRIHTHRRKLQYKSLSLQRLIWVLLLVNIGVITGSFQGNYELAFAQVQEVLDKQPYVFRAVTDINSELVSSLFFLREAKLATLDHIQLLYLPENNQFAPFFPTISSVLTHLTTDYSSLRGRNEAYSSDLSLTSAHFSFLYSPSSPSSPFFHFGFTPALLSLPNTLFSCLFASTPGYSETCMVTEREILLLITENEVNQMHFHTSMDERTNQTQGKAVTVMSVSLTVSVLYVLLVYIPVVVRLKNVLKREVDVYELLTSSSNPDHCSTEKQVSTYKASLPTSALVKSSTVVFGA